MPRHGRIEPPVPPVVAPMEPVVAPAERRWGLLTGETALVLGLIGVIVAGTFLVDTIQPASERTNTIYGKTTMKVHNLGKGGIQPGEVQPRAYIPPQNLVSTPGEVPVEPPPPTPIATKAPQPTSVATPKPTTGTGTPPILTPPDNGGGTQGCGLLGLGTCPPKETPQPSITAAGTPPAATDTQPQTATKKTPKKPTSASSAPTAR